MCQSNKLEQLSKAYDSDSFISNRAKIQYVATSTRPDLCAPVQLLACTPESVNKEKITALHKITDFCVATKHIGLKFVKLDIKTIRLLLFTDASFANCNNLKSQIGFLLVLADGSNNANILHYGSSRCKRITRSVMAAEVHGLIHGFDAAYVTRHMMEEILGKEIPMDIFVDSRTLFNIVAKDASPSEKRLKIDIWALKESYNKKEFENLYWIEGEKNPADPLTKSNLSTKTALWKIMTTNKVHLEPLGWTELLNSEKAQV